MKDLVSHQLVKYLENRGIKHIFGLCGHTNIAVLSALEKSSIDVYQRPPRADRRPCGRWIRAGNRQGRGRTEPSGTRD